MFCVKRAFCFFLFFFCYAAPNWNNARTWLIKERKKLNKPIVCLTDHSYVKQWNEASFGLFGLGKLMKSVDKTCQTSKYIVGSWYDPEVVLGYDPKWKGQDK